MSVELCVVVYEVTAGFPKSETYGLVGQMRRAAVSIASNIAEGHARQHTAEYVQFLSIARGSLAELDTQTVIASRLGYLKIEAEAGVSTKLASISKMLWSLHAALRKS